MARISGPAEAGVPADSYRVHPGLLDSAFQVPVAALDASAWSGLAGQGPVVVTRVDRIDSHGAAGSRFWCHARMERRDGAELAGCVHLRDETRTDLLTCRGLELRVLEDGSDVRDLLCEERWEPAPRALTCPSAIAAAVGPRLGELMAETGFADYYAAVEPTLNAMAARSVRAALTELGWRDSDAGEDACALGDRLGVSGRHRRLFERLLAIAVALGDGVLAEFDGPARAISAATGLRDAVSDLGIDIRVGMHGGEVEVLERDFGGIAVHIAARVVALAAPGEVLASSTVRELMAGSGTSFHDRGTHVLKGLPEPWHLFAVG